MADSPVKNILGSAVETLGTLAVSSGSFSSLPQTITKEKISSKHVVLKAVLSNPSAQTGDWTVTTSDGSLTISGSISGTTTVKLYLTYEVDEVTNQSA